MRIFDLNGWRKFKLSELFDIRPTKAYKKVNRELFDSDGINPVVVNSSFNNGIGGYTSLPNTEEGNIITFSDTTTSKAIFYQESAFVGYPHVQGVYPKCNKEFWTKKVWLFFLTAFRRAAICKGFDYVNKFTRELALNIEVYLPVTKDGENNRSYMVSYIDRMYSYQSKRFGLLGNCQKGLHIIKYEYFHSFSLCDIFDINMGSKLDMVKMSTTNPEIDFVGRSSENQGVTCKVNRIDGVSPYSAGNLTLALGGQYLGSCFVQRNEFYTSQNVVVLIPRVNLSIETKLFISTTIFRESQLHYKAFIDELNRHIKKDFRIILPSVEKEGRILPDFDLMHKYFSKILDEQRSNIDSLLV